MTSASAALAPPSLSARRPLGRTGFLASAAAIGDLADASIPFDDSVAILRRALDAGLNVIDTAPAYENGLSEQLVGAAVRERPRDSVFVIDKIDLLEAPVAPQIDESLARLRLDHVDLFVFHGLRRLEDWEALTRPGGGFAQLAACARAGQCRFRGISCHDPDVLLAALASGLCDVVMFPVGPFVDRRYITEGLPAARAAGVGVVSFKTFGAGMLVAETAGYGRPLEAPRSAPAPALSIAECLRYTLSRGPDVALLGLSTAAEQDAAFTAAQNLVTMSDAELAACETRASAAIAGKGRCWWNPEPPSP